MDLNGVFSSNDRQSFLAYPLLRQAQEIDTQRRLGFISDERATALFDEVFDGRSSYPGSYQGSPISLWLQGRAALVTGICSEKVGRLWGALRYRLLPSSFSTPLAEPKIISHRMVVPDRHTGSPVSQYARSFDFEKAPYETNFLRFPLNFGHLSEFRSSTQRGAWPTDNLQAKVGRKSGCVSMVMTSPLPPIHCTSPEDFQQSESFADTLGSHLSDEIDLAVSSLFDPTNSEDVKQAICKALHPGWLENFNSVFTKLAGETLFGDNAAASVTAVVWHGKFMFVAQAGLHTLLRLSPTEESRLAQADCYNAQGYLRNLLERPSFSDQISALQGKHGSLSGVFFSDHDRRQKPQVKIYSNAVHDDENEAPLLVLFDAPLPRNHDSASIDWRLVANEEPKNAVLSTTQWLDRCKTDNITRVAAFRCPTLVVEDLWTVSSNPFI